MDVPERRVDARHELAGADRPRNRLAPGCELVSGGGMALKPLWREYTAVDIATAAYIAIATGAVLLSFRGDGIPGWPWILSAHTLIVALVLRSEERRVGKECRCGLWVLRLGE